jgi:hypothetical protein
MVLVINLKEFIYQLLCPWMRNILVSTTKRSVEMRSLLPLWSEKREYLSKTEILFPLKVCLMSILYQLISDLDKELTF